MPWLLAAEDSGGGYVSLWTAIVALISSLVAGGGVVKVLDWLSNRQKVSSEAKTQERLDMVKEYSTFLGELRGEIHTLRDRLNVALLKHENCERDLATLRVKTDQLQERVHDLEASGGVATITADAEGIVKAWSPAATDIFGWAGAEAIGRDLADLIVPPEYRPVHKAALSSCAAEDRPPRAAPLIFRAQDKWRRTFLIEVSLTGNKAGDSWFYTANIRRRAEKFDSGMLSGNTPPKGTITQIRVGNGGGGDVSGGSSSGVKNP